ncbi:coagulation factor XIII A chain-like [Clarias magur]|uniref:Coagulation factor XIII A chain-like n=1 Tax=Clarias magur TaxID=1594786 RepID=A0A8J4X829_CLAMG|nr:coagulation factor XIII A chain-like [Clarias magur]
MPAFNTHERTQGRLNYQISCNNQENSTLPEVELFSEAAPRAPMPTGANLTVSNINMYESINKYAHHTKAYNLSNLIIRRGQEFIMGIAFNRRFNREMDMFFIEFVIGNSPSITQNTLICLTIGGNNQNNAWGVRVAEISNSEIKVGITPAADSIVGLYSTYVSVITGYGKQRSQRNQTTDFYMLFNPWSRMDQVYLDNEDERQEYVLNDVGMIYNGEHTDIGTRPWNYGQFQKGILEACIFIMDLGKMPLQYRGNAEQVVRKASALMNSLADNGVLVGNWGSEFGSGTSPSAWTGSVEILRQYYKSGGVSVKYGQCWVFAGVYNTFLRCLGLPARVITNYCSAHDSGGQLTTDIILNDDGSLDTDGSDSIWNFHCWNEVFLKRSSMPEIYSGWQVVDATPQEISDGYYRCGPTAVEAIKTKSLGYSFDARFVYAEVNSDVIFYQKDQYGNLNVIFQDSNYVGKLVLTKMIGSNNYNNITDSYKNIKSLLRRQTPEEDSCVPGSNRFILPDTDVQLYFEATKNNKDIILTMTFNNLSNEPRTITCKITGKVEYYTGATRTQFSFITHDVSLQALEAYLLQTVGAVGKCDTVFKGFSNCLLQLGESMSSYPPDMGEKENLQTICTYWDDFHSCATTALADCQEGATELWEKLKKESRNLQFKGSLFELCGGVNDASTPSASPTGLPLLLSSLSALLTWIQF